MDTAAAHASDMFLFSWMRRINARLQGNLDHVYTGKVMHNSIRDAAIAYVKKAARNDKSVQDVPHVLTQTSVHKLVEAGTDMLRLLRSRPQTEQDLQVTDNMLLYTLWHGECTACPPEPCAHAELVGMCATCCDHTRVGMRDVAAHEVREHTPGGRRNEAADDAQFVPRAPDNPRPDQRLVKFLEMIGRQRHVDGEAHDVFDEASLDNLEVPNFEKAEKLSRYQDIAIGIDTIGWCCAAEHIWHKCHQSVQIQDCAPEETSAATKDKSLELVRLGLVRAILDEVNQYTSAHLTDRLAFDRAIHKRAW